MTRHLRPERSAAWRVQRRPAWLAAVLLGHVALLLGWRLALAPWRAAPMPAREQAAMVWLNLPTESPTTAPPAVASASPRRQNADAPPSRPTMPLQPAAATPLERPPAPEPTARPPAETALRMLPPDAPASAASQPPLRLLDSAATRQALREAARQPLLSERAADATGQGFVSGAQRMADAASAAGKGDCVKGDYAGAGMGLLSAPFLLVAAARGQCAR